MRLFLFLLVVVMTIASCSTTYQYMTLDSSQMTRNDRKQFTWENDTVRLTYDFNGYAGPMSLNIYNKSSQPLYINWKKSVLIQDGQSVSLYDRNVNFTGSANSIGTRLGNIAVSNSNINGSFALPEGVDFIAPSSSISRTLLSLGLSGHMPPIIPDSLANERVADGQGYTSYRFRHLHLSEGESSVNFKSYLTFALGSNTVFEFSESNSFYVADIFRTNAHPENFAQYHKQGDQFFIIYHQN